MFLVRRETHSCPTCNTPRHVRTESLILADSGTQCLSRLVVSSTQPGGDQPFVQKNMPGQDIYCAANHGISYPLMPYFIRCPHERISQRPLTGEFIIVSSIVSPLGRRRPVARSRPRPPRLTNCVVALASSSLTSQLLRMSTGRPPRRTRRRRRLSSRHGAHCGPPRPSALPAVLV